MPTKSEINRDGYKYTKQFVEQMVREAAEDECPFDTEELEHAFAAIYERPADSQDRAEGLWSHICAAVD